MRRPAARHRVGHNGAAGPNTASMNATAPAIGITAAGRDATAGITAAAGRDAADGGDAVARIGYQRCDAVAIAVAGNIIIVISVVAEKNKWYSTTV